MKYHIIAHGDDTPAFTRALGHALHLTLQSQSKQMLIKIGQLSNATGIMSDVLGETAVKKLIKDKQITINLDQDTITIYLEGNRTRRSNFSGGTVFAPWETPDSLESVLTDHRTHDSVYVPWLSDELTAYLAKHNSTEI